jgi:SAM-dependent methyltransferase
MGKYQIQESQYDFPYHHIPHIENGTLVRSRYLRWGFRYFCYLMRVKEIVISLNPKSILDIGCGDGRFLGMFKDSYKRVGIDLSAKAIQFAKAFHNDVTFLVNDGKNLGEQFDVVTAIEVLEHIPDEKVGEFFHTCAKNTMKGGRVIIVIPTLATPLQSKHYRHYNKNVFEKQLQEAGVPLTIEHIEYAYKETLLLRLYYRLTSNRFFNLEIKNLDRVMWRYVHKRLCVAKEQNGQDMIVVLFKQ